MSRLLLIPALLLAVAVPSPALDDSNSVLQVKPKSSPRRGSVAATTKAPDRTGMVRIPAGCFQMGARSCEAPSGEGQFDECPQHRVCLDSFWMDATEVTQGAYRGMVGSNPSGFSTCGDDCPVEKVSWDEARAYCKRLRKRLPTEAEWEYAARAGTTTKWHWGDHDSLVGEYAWYDGNSGLRTHPVGQQRANPWGLFDMAGNVYEWTADRHGYYSSGAQRNPSGPQSGPRRVTRGGGWYTVSPYLRSALRASRTPDERDFATGFRCLLPGR